MTVHQVLSSMSASEFTEWMAFDQIDPFGESRADLRAGLVAAAVVNHSMSPPKDPARPIDFMPFARRNAGPVLLDDPVEHGKLIARTLFADGLVVKGRS